MPASSLYRRENISVRSRRQLRRAAPYIPCNEPKEQEGGSFLAASVDVILGGGEEVAVIADVFEPSYNRSKELTSGGRVMRMHSVISHGVTGCVGVIAGYVFATGHLAIVPSFAQTPAAGQRSTELFNRVMEDVLGRRLTVRLTERDPGNGSAAHRHPGSHTVGYILEGTYEVKIDEGPVRTLKPGDVFYEAPNALHAISRNPSSTQPLKYLVIQVSDPTKPATIPE
jgi:quercetin dioxygenase-like cupin family protein